jgi:hypothetical protein
MEEGGGEGGGDERGRVTEVMKRGCLHSILILAKN